MNIGLTGGIGCGKSTALAHFARRGAWVFDADQCVRQLLAEDPEVRNGILRNFGPEVLGTDGMVDRRALALIVFENSSKLEVLESLLHHRVRTTWQQELDQGHPCFVVEIPLLFEKSLASLFNVTVCVAASEQTQRERLRARGLDDAQFELRRNRQWPIERKMDAADHVLCNDGDRAHLEAQIDHLLGAWGCMPS